jgi:hypothetical protein
MGDAWIRRSRIRARTVFIGFSVGGLLGELPAAFWQGNLRNGREGRQER